MLTKLKRMVKFKTCINILLSVVILALVYYISNCIKSGGLKRIQNARNAVWMYDSTLKTYLGQSVSSRSEGSSYSESLESESEGGEEHGRESADNDTVTVPEDNNLEEDQGSEIPGGDIARTVSVPSREEPVFIIILAQWRFGSSVIGELFNQNSGVFFLYEPLWVVEQMVRLWRVPGPFAPETYFYARKLMGDFARCDFSDEYIGMVNLTNNWGGKFRNRVICERTDDDCNIPDAEWLRNVCLKFEGHLAAKLIRGDLSTIKSLVVDDHINVKVIHLVRDPRGSTASRINYMYSIANNELAHPKYSKAGRLELLKLLEFKDRQSDSIQGMCQWVRETAFPFDQMPEWLKDRYYRLRYEDFADDPSRITEELYKFVGLKLPKAVRKWVSRNTQAKHSAEGTFDVKKNASLIARHWIQDLSPVEIQQVEARCSDVMKILGYELFDDLQH